MVDQKTKEALTGETTIKLIDCMNAEISKHIKLGGNVIVSSVMGMCDHYQLGAIEIAAEHLNDTEDADRLSAQNNLSVIKKAFQNNIDYINRCLIKCDTNSSC